MSDLPAQFDRLEPHVQEASGGNNEPVVGGTEKYIPEDFTAQDENKDKFLIPVSGGAGSKPAEETGSGENKEKVITDEDKVLLFDTNKSLEIIDSKIPGENDAELDIHEIKNLLFEIFENPEAFELADSGKRVVWKGNYRSHQEEYFALRRKEDGRELVIAFQSLRKNNPDANYFYLEALEKYSEFLKNYGDYYKHMNMDMSRFRENPNVPSFYERAQKNKEAMKGYVYIPLETISFALRDPEGKKSYSFEVSDTPGGPFATIIDSNASDKRRRYVTDVPIQLGDRWKSEDFHNVAQHLSRKIKDLDK
jgi:hypothetical protein